MKKSTARLHRPSELLQALKRLGFGAAIAVPDSWLGGFWCASNADGAMRLVQRDP